ncbi:Clr5 domain-containing protein, partial [Cercophora newfieldiana]
MVRADPDQHQSSPGSWVGGDEWDIHRPAIQELYQNQNLALKEVMRLMEETHGFRATQRMYKTRIKSWGLDKNFKESEVVELFRLRRERDRIGKPTVYAIRGREVDWDRVHTYVRRKGLDIVRLVDDASPPASSSSSAREVTCRTPTPEPERLTSPASTISSSFSSSSTTTAASSPNDARTALPTPTASYSFPAHRISRPSSIAPTTSPSKSPQPLAMTRERVRSMQQFLSCIYDRVMFEDGDRVWGTTEYWVRNNRSQEWITTVRVKLALYREHLSPTSGAASRGFRTLNRAFAMLEPLSAGIIGTRLFYFVNFLFSF